MCYYINSYYRTTKRCGGNITDYSDTTARVEAETESEIFQKLDKILDSIISDLGCKSPPLKYLGANPALKDQIVLKHEAIQIAITIMNEENENTEKYFFIGCYSSGLKGSIPILTFVKRVLPI